MIALLKRRLSFRRGDEGVAMVLVLGIGLVLTMLIIGGVALSLGSSKKASTDANWNGALAAAYAGIEEYQSRLSEEPAYVKYGNPASAFSWPNHAVTAKVQLPPTAPVDKTNPAFGLGTTGTWAIVEGSYDPDTQSTDSAAKYRYEVDNTTYYDTGTIRLRATGKVGNETRSIVADLRQKGFIDFLYFTDYEISDPATADTRCNPKHAWEDSTRSYCSAITFRDGDGIDGPVHSNDTLRLCGTVFDGVVTTGDPDGGYTYPGGTGCSRPTLNKGAVQFSPSISMPTSNTQIKKETRYDLTEEVPRPGCLYTGPTSITLLDGGKMIVKSPWTRFTNIKGDPVTEGNNDNSGQCGTETALRSTAGATLDVPKNNVIYVQNIPLSGTNGTAEAYTTNSSTGRCRARGASDTTLGADQSNNVGYSRNVVGYPITDETPPTAGTSATSSYGCRNGDLFISGMLSSGAGLTVAAENYVYATGDITYKDSVNDMLGIVGNNAIWVHNPMKVVSGKYTALNAKSRRIDAAVLSVAHTFAVQNHSVGGERGTLTVNGAIAQKFRGVVGLLDGTGYSKDYNYDKRFTFSAPPKFLSPVTTTYGVTVWVEISPVFKADGTYR